MAGLCSGVPSEGVPSVCSDEVEGWRRTLLGGRNGGGSEGCVMVDMVRGAADVKLPPLMDYT